MIWVLWLLAVAYAVLTITLWHTWKTMPVLRSGGPISAPSPTITVVIPVRNEAHNLPALLADLDRQTYPHFEVLVADDASTDETGAIAVHHAQTSRYKLSVLQLDDVPALTSPKKRAISHSIAQATGTLIVTTDGDCRVGPRWLESIAGCYAQTGAKLISGPVTFTTEPTVFGSLQTVEFASLIGAGAATMALNVPTMCNGANLCYEKTAFTDVDGFAGIDHVASGDDELLMHKIAARYPGGVRFLKNRDAIVETGAHQTVGAFYQQRKRWAGKWRTYTSVGPTLLAVFVFLSNLTPVVAVSCWGLGTLPPAAVVGIVFTKLLPEFVYLRNVLVFLRKQSAVSWIPLTQLIYPFYVLFFGLAAQKPGIVWKGRKLK